MPETWTTPPTWVAADVPDADGAAKGFNKVIKGNERYLYLRPAIILDRSSGFDVPTGGWTAITFPAADELVDTDGMHSDTNSSRITFARAGRILAGGSIQWLSGIAGSRGLRVRLNGAGAEWASVMEDASGAPGWTYPATCLAPVAINVAANDYIELDAFQDSGATINCLPVLFWAAWMMRAAL